MPIVYWYLSRSTFVRHVKPAGHGASGGVGGTAVLKYSASIGCTSYFAVNDSV
jgi:hypothetical protein